MKNACAPGGRDGDKVQGDDTATPPVPVQLEKIRLRLDAFENYVDGLSETAKGIVSYAEGGEIEGALSDLPHDEGDSLSCDRGTA